MAEIIQTVATPPPEAAASWSIWHLVALILIIIIIWVFYLALKKRNAPTGKDKFYEAYTMIRQLCLQGADDRYFRSWWFPSKNAPIYRVFEFLETDKIRLEPLIGLDCRYMGHFLDFGGNYNIAFFVGRKFFVPMVEVVQVPHTLVHMQDNMVVVNCVRARSSLYFNSSQYLRILLSVPTIRASCFSFIDIS